MFTAPRHAKFQVAQFSRGKPNEASDPNWQLTSLDRIAEETMGKFIGENQSKILTGARRQEEQ